MIIDYVRNRLTSNGCVMGVDLLLNLYVQGIQPLHCVCCGSVQFFHSSLWPSNIKFIRDVCSSWLFCSSILVRVSVPICGACILFVSVARSESNLCYPSPFSGVIARNSFHWVINQDELIRIVVFPFIIPFRVYIEFFGD